MKKFWSELKKIDVYIYILNWMKNKFLKIFRFWQKNSGYKVWYHFHQKNNLRKRPRTQILPVGFSIFHRKGASYDPILTTHRNDFTNDSIIKCLILQLIL